MEYVIPEELKKKVDSMKRTLNDLTKLEYLNRIYNNDCALKDSLDSVDSYLTKVFTRFKVKNDTIKEKENKPSSTITKCDHFIDFINFCINNSIDFDLVIGGVNMNQKFSFSPSWIITDYFREQFKDLFQAKCEIRSFRKIFGPPDNTVILLDFNDYNIGYKFTDIITGAIDIYEWDKYIKNIDK